MFHFLFGVFAGFFVLLVLATGLVIARLGK